MQPNDTVKLIVLTDLHVTPPDELILGISPLKRLDAAVDHINRHHRDAARIVVTGDITHYGDKLSYQLAKAALDRLHAPKTLLVGNHDCRSHFIEVFGEEHIDTSGFIQTSIDIGRWRLVSLDTLNGPPYAHHGIHEGHLCEKRLTWLDRTLACAEGRQVMIFMHHPPHEVGFRGMDAIRLQNEERFFQVLGQHTCVRHIVCGHIHRTISGVVRGIGFSIFKSPVHQQPMTFEDDDTSASIAEPAAYGILFARPSSIIAHTEDYELSSSLALD